MSAPTLTEVTPYAVVADAWQVYRMAQLLPVPANAGDLIMARDRLHTLLDPHCRTYGRPVSDLKPDVAAIEDAVDALVAAVEWHCGGEAAARISGEEGPA